MAVNHSPTDCVICGCPIPPLGGNECGIGFAHPACIEAIRRGDNTPQVIEIRTSGGTFTRNSKRRCIDAPACGCCNF